MKELMPDVHKTFHHFTGMVGFWSVGGGSSGSLSFKPWVLKTGCWLKHSYHLVIHQNGSTHQGV